MRWGRALPWCLSATAVCSLWFAPLRINESRSEPIGVWHITTAGSLERGRLVTACPAVNASLRQGVERGWVPGSWIAGCHETALMPLFKTAAAVAGDVVTVTEAGIEVNGQLLPDTVARGADGQGRGLISVPPGTYPVAPGEVWLLGEGPDSFDSRYWGPVHVREIVGFASPVLTF